MDRKYFDAIKAGLEQMQEACADKKKMTEAEQEPTEPKTEKEKKLAALAEPKDKITHADVLKGRGVTKEEAEQIDEISKKTLGSYVQKSGKEIENSVVTGDAKKAWNRAKGVQVAGKKLAKEEVEEQHYSEIVEKFDDFEVIVKESYTFAEYLDAAKTMVAEDQAVVAADAAYRAQDTGFMLESFVRADIESKVAAHKNAGNKVSSVSYSTKSGQPYAEYTVTDKEGTSRKYIHHGNTRKVENLGS